eukprot:maker-scaffold72_size415059-snap-gene-3.21 protein:Tk08681 transcript:maker-scaffold72_size415059-snap-gene-3.21-mRNA-1 annotation:"thyroid receptor-interacting protein 11"
MAAWFNPAHLSHLQGSIDSLKNSVSNSLKEVFEEEADPTDPNAHLALTREKLATAQSLIQSQQSELLKLEERVAEIQEEKQAVELQKEVQCRQFRELLREKERELAHPDHPEAAPGQPRIGAIAPEIEDRVAELERQLVEERQNHEHALWALQETFARSEAPARPADPDQAAEEPEEPDSADPLAGPREAHWAAEIERWKSQAAQLTDDRQTQLAQLAQAVAEAQVWRERYELQASEAAQVAELVTESALAPGVDGLRRELAEERERLDDLVTENALKDDVIAALKDERGLLKAESHASRDTIESMQRGADKYREIVTHLEESLTEQVALNQQLRASLAETTDLNQQLETEMSRIAETSQVHEIALNELRDQLKSFQATEAELNQFKIMYDAQESELKSSLADQSEHVEKITSETSVYKQQYEQLLQEYNQYLEDLELVQAKAESLEKLKSLHEAKMTELNESHVRDQTRMSALDEKLKENERQRELLEKSGQKAHGRAEELEHDLGRERAQKRELQERIEDQDILIEDLKNGLQMSKESSVCEEKEQDESEGRHAPDLVQSLRSEIDGLRQERSFADELLELRGKREELAEVNERQVEEISRLEAIIQEFNVNVNETSQKIEDQRELLLTTESELEQYKEQVADSNRKFEDHAQQFQSLQLEFEEYMSNAEEGQERLAEITQDLDTARQDRDHWKAQLDLLTQEKAEMSSQLDQQPQIEASLRGKDEEIVNLKECLATLKTANETVTQDQNTTIDGLRLRIQGNVQLEEDLAELNQTLAALKLDMSTKVSECSRLQDEHDTLTNLARAREDEFAVKCQELNDVKDAMKNLASDLEDARTRMASDQTRTLELESQIRALNNDNNLEELKRTIDAKGHEIRRMEADNKSLLDRLTHITPKVENQEKEMESEKEDMTKETVNKLSELIRDKDMEIQALQERNKGLVELVQKHEDPPKAVQADGDNIKITEEINGLKQENQDLLAALGQKHQESLNYYAEIERLTQMMGTSNPPPEMQRSSSVSEKCVMDNSNEIIILKAKIKELERKLNRARFESQTSRPIWPRRRYHSESLHENEPIELLVDPGIESESVKVVVDETAVSELSAKVQERDTMIRDRCNQVLELQKNLIEREESLTQREEEIRTLKRKVESLDLHQTDSLRRLDELKFELENVQIENKKVAEENQGLASANNRFKVLVEEKGHDLEMAQRNLQQLREMVDEKSQNSESIQQERLHNLAAITELQNQVGALKRQSDEARLRLVDRDRELAETRREVTNVIEKKKRLEQELERLRQHLLTVEDTYTQEALATEERERELRRKLQVTEEALRVSSAQHSTSNQESSLQVESLQRQVNQLSEQRDQLLHKLGKVTQEFQSQSTALDNLTMVLEGFQEEKENNLKLAEKDYRERLERDSGKRNALQSEIKALHEKLSNANEGLTAANRLGEQLEKKSQVIATLKQEIKLREELLKKAQHELSTISTHNAGKVDKSLIKNLVVGYVCADVGKRPEVLKVVATVLDFNGEERQKTGLDGASNTTWLRGWFSQQPPAVEANSLRLKTTSSDVQTVTGLDQGLAQAFIKFLEHESTPKVPPKLPVSEMAETKTRQMEAEMNSSLRSSTNSTPTEGISAGSHVDVMAGRATGRGSPNPLLALNNAHTLPTFSVNRSSSAILKHVLHEEDQQPSTPPPRDGNQS